MTSLRLLPRQSTSLHQLHFIPASLNPTCPSPLCSLPLTSSSSSPRPTLDDVERLSWGQASKAKIGSRAVPHRLNVDERKVWTRHYPLANTFRNYCDALGWPCLRIDQGPAGSLDNVIVDLTTLRLQDMDLMALKTQIYQTIGCKGFSGKNDRIVNKQFVPNFEASSCVDLEMRNVPNNFNTTGPITEVTYNLEQEDIGPGLINFHATRSEAKNLCQALHNCCKAFMSKKPLA